MPGTWTFLTNHGHVLVAVAADPHARLREIAARVGITERAAQLIVRDLEASGYLSKERVGRRNRYQLHRGRPFRHTAEADRSVDQMLAIFVSLGGDRDGSPGSAERADRDSRVEQDERDARLA